MKVALDSSQNGGDGGIVYAENSDLFIEDSDFIDNRAARGVAINGVQCVVHISNCNFKKNTVDTFGVVYTVDSTISILGGRFSKNVVGDGE